MALTPEELAMMLGQRDIEIYFLQKQLAALRAEIERLKKEAAQ